MRYFRIFLLHFQEAFENRGTSFVWILLSIIGPLIGLSYWIAVYHSQKGSIVGWELSSVTSYYFLLIVAGGFLIAHREFVVAERDIHEGNLASFLLKPFSYFWNNFFGELPWRIHQGVLGIIVVFIFSQVFGSFLQVTSSPLILALAFLSFVLGLLLSFVFKMILGLTAFWLTDFRGLQNIVEIMILIFAGFIMPLDFYPHALRVVADVLPFASMVYYPVSVLQGNFTVMESIQVVFMQIIWISLLVGLYKLMWNKGIRGFTSVGQ